jgi:surface antigen
MSLQLLALLMLAVQLPGQALAQPADNSPRYWFLDRLGARDLVPADWALLRQNIQLALYELTDGESVGWTEPVSEHSGSVRVVSTVKEGDRVCRRLRVSVDADAGSDDGVFELCRSGSTGFWRLTTSTLALHD